MVRSPGASAAFFHIRREERLEEVEEARSRRLSEEGTDFGGPVDEGEVDFVGHGPEYRWADFLACTGASKAWGRRTRLGP